VALLLEANCGVSQILGDLPEHWQEENHDESKHFGFSFTRFGAT
jgi:hypothetical protein